MKKILFILMLTIVTVYAKPCTTDIYFGNGVWNEENDAIKSMRQLRKLMFSSANNRLDRVKEGVDYNFKHAYNPTRGTTDDLIETFFQLKESGQITRDYFMAVYTALATESNGEAFTNKLIDIISNYNSDASTMFSLYQQSSFNQKNNVLLVAHSQGNLFGNKMYTLMSDAQKKKFRMVSVATPADHVAGHTSGGPYVTATGDYVIRPIPGSLPANIAGSGHTFIGTYLNVPGGGAPGDGSDNAPKIIALHVNSAYDNLIQASSCGGYDQIFMHMYELNYIKVYGRPSGTYASEEIGTVSLETYNPPIKVVIPNKPQDIIIYICSQDTILYGGNLDIFGLPGYGQTDDYFTYNPGTIFNKQTLESREGLSYTITSRDGKKCTDVSFSGQLYDLALSAFD